MKILVLGAGGIGGYFGAQLLRSGADLTFLLRARRKALVDAQGLRIETPGGDFTVRAATVTAASVTPVYDLIVLAPKAYDLDDALASLEGALGAAVLLPLLNGFDHLDLLDRRCGRARVMGGVAQISTTLTAGGAVRELADFHRLTLGARDAAHAAQAHAFAALCAAAPFDCALVDDIEQAMWEKWTFLAALAAMTTLCRGPVGEIVATPHGAELALRMYAECCAVAGANGHPIGAEARARAAQVLTQAGSPIAASMLRDLESGRRTEHDHILGALAARGRAAGLAMDLVHLAHTHLAVQAAHRPRA